MKWRLGFNGRWGKGGGLFVVGTRHVVPVVDAQGSQVRSYFRPQTADAKRSSLRGSLGRMERVINVCALAFVFALVFCASAAAAPVLEVSVSHEPGTINRGDEYVSYSVKVKNVGDVPTSGTTNVVVDLPAGMKMDGGSGSGWSCFSISRPAPLLGCS